MTNDPQAFVEPSERHCSPSADGLLNPFVFIVGCPRSGTTLLQRIVNAHPEIAVIHETSWLPGWYEKRVGLTPDGYVTPELVSRLMDRGRFRKLGITRAELQVLVDSDQRIDYATFVSRVFDLYGSKHAKRIVGEKTPRYVRTLPALHSLWPTAKFVHIIRDGRDVCLSSLDWRERLSRKGIERLRHLANMPSWSGDRLSTTALWWEWHVRLGRESGAVLGPDLYFEVRYESLVDNTQRVCEKLCDFMGVPYEESMDDFEQAPSGTSPGFDAREARRESQPITSGLRDWRRHMTREDLERFEAASGELLSELEYPRDFRRVAAGVHAHAAQVRDEFVSGLRSRSAELPTAWQA